MRGSGCIVMILVLAGAVRALAAEPSTPEQVFAESVQPHLGFCRTCHVPNGIADVEKGKRFQLSNDTAEDFAKVQAAWIALGGGVDGNLLLTMPSDPSVSHTGGKPWPAGSAAYEGMRALLACFADPQSCAGGGGGGGGGGDPALLGNPGKHFFVNQRCDGQPDETTIDWSQDPRRLISGENIDNDEFGVHFNDPFEICRTDKLFETQAKQNALRVAKGKPPIHSAKRPPATCGEWRAAVKSGHDWINGVPTTGGVVPASSWNNLWKTWGLAKRPTDFDTQITERYGNPPVPAHVRNPYPLPGEDPATTDGGSGKLPLGWVQDKDATGKYNGQLGINCFICHSAQVGKGEIAGRDANQNPGSYGANATGSFMGLPNTNQDFGLQIVDLAQQGGAGSLFLPATIVPVNVTRGTHNADGDIELIVALRDFDNLELRHAFLDPIHANFGDQDPPAWWWLHNKTRYLWFGGHSTDSARGNMYFGTVNLFTGDYNKSREGVFEDVHQWTLTIEAPTYPGPIDTALAEQGAILFHEKNLWADGQNADIPKPNGAGSCAGCHGAYSPRYANDRRFLPDPRLVGTTGYTVPLEIVGTDPAQAAGWSKEIRPHVSTFWWAYPDAVEGYKLPEEKDPLTEFIDDYAMTDGITGANVADHFRRTGQGMGALQPFADALAESPLLRATEQLPGIPLGESFGRVKGACAFEEKTVGYVTPPLHGVWASAPYFHNGSVPTVWDVLKPSDRPSMWRRQMTPNGITSGPDRGFEHELDLAYDHANLGWKHDVMSCGADARGVPYFTCQPDMPLPTEIVWLKDALLGGILWPIYGQITPINQEIVEVRKIYNTNLYSKKNIGHEWTKILTDAERRALIEYLKTL